MNPSPKQQIQVVRHDLRFDSGESYCSAWLFLPVDVERPPVVVLGHGLGAIREMRLDAFAERFAAQGIAALAFTYRYFGDSGGEPRQLMSVPRQLEDWEAALNYVKSRQDLDSNRLAVWGSSFGGGHAITMASRHPELRAAVAQCPFTDGFASATAQGLIATIKGSMHLLPLALRDFSAKRKGRAPVTVPIAGYPGQLALMNTHDALDGYVKLVPKGAEFANRVAARVIPEIMMYRPGLSAPNIKCPILFCVSDTDTVTPPGRTLVLARRAPRGNIKRYNAGHFDFYFGAVFEQLVSDQLHFLVEHLVPTTPLPISR